MILEATIPAVQRVHVIVPGVEQAAHGVYHPGRKFLAVSGVRRPVRRAIGILPGTTPGQAVESIRKEKNNKCHCKHGTSPGQMTTIPPEMAFDQHSSLRRRSPRLSGLGRNAPFSFLYSLILITVAPLY